MDPRHIIPNAEALALNRRAFLYRLGYGLGGLAFTTLPLLAILLVLAPLSVTIAGIADARER